MSDCSPHNLTKRGSELVSPRGIEPRSEALQATAMTTSAKATKIGELYEDRTHTIGSTNRGAGHYTNNSIEINIVWNRNFNITQQNLILLVRSLQTRLTRLKKNLFLKN